MDAQNPSPEGSGTVTMEDLVAWLRRSAQLLGESATELNDLDSAIGDGDHGTNMKRGFSAVVEMLDGAGAGLTSVDALMKKVGSTLVSSVGGASGPLYGTFFLRMGTSQQGVEQLDAYSLQSALQAGVDGISQRGRSMIGQKTMLDAWVPALDAYQRGADDLALALQAGAKAAAQGRDETAQMVAMKGRASYLGERAVGHVDPGAASTAILWQAATDTLGAGATGTADSSEAANYGIDDAQDATS